MPCETNWHRCDWLDFQAGTLVSERRKRVIGIIAGILVARRLKTNEDLFDFKPSPRAESLAEIGSGTMRDGATFKRFRRFSFRSLRFTAILREGLSEAGQGPDC